MHWAARVHDLGLDEAVWAERPSYIALAHELIHAWRWISGKAVFHPDIGGRSTEGSSYHEEAMTVGLAPYDGCPYTENAVRQSLSEPRRGWYAQDSKGKTDKAAQKTYPV